MLSRPRTQASRNSAVVGLSEPNSIRFCDRERVGGELADGQRRAVDGQRRDDGVDTAAVGEAGVHHRAGLVDAAADPGHDLVDGPAQVRLVGEVGVGRHQPARLLQPDAVVAVDHDLGDVRVAQVGLDRAVAQDVVADLLGDAGPVAAAQRPVLRRRARRRGPCGPRCPARSGPCRSRRGAGPAAGAAGRGRCSSAPRSGRRLRGQRLKPRRAAARRAVAAGDLLPPGSGAASATGAGHGGARPGRRRGARHRASRPRRRRRGVDGRDGVGERGRRRGSPASSVPVVRVARRHGTPRAAARRSARLMATYASSSGGSSPPPRSAGCVASGPACGADELAGQRGWPAAGWPR